MAGSRSAGRVLMRVVKQRRRTTRRRREDLRQSAADAVVSTAAGWIRGVSRPNACWKSLGKLRGLGAFRDAAELAAAAVCGLHQVRSQRQTWTDAPTGRRPETFPSDAVGFDERTPVNIVHVLLEPDLLPVCANLGHAEGRRWACVN
jgi:hypothetical protein